MVDLTEGWLNPNPGVTGQFVYYNRSLLASHGADWFDLWCDDYTCSSCKEYWAENV